MGQVQRARRGPAGCGRLRAAGGRREDERGQVWEKSNLLAEFFSLGLYSALKRN